MISYVSSSIYSVNHSRHASMQMNNEDSRKFQEKMGNGIDVNGINREEHQLLEQQERKNKVDRENRQDKPQSPSDLAMRFAKGYKLSKEEDNFLSDKFPKLKSYAELVREEGKELKNSLDNSKNEEEAKKVILNAMENVQDQSQKGVISDFMVRMKMASIESVKNGHEKFSQRFNEVQLNLQPGALVDQFA